MLYYDRIDISKGNDLAKSNHSKECIICHYWLFNHGFKFQDSVFNGCHVLTMLSANISDIAIIIIKNVDCCCIIDNISTSEAINLLEISVLENCVYIYIYIQIYCFKFQSNQDSFFYFFCFSIYKMVDSMDTYYALNISIGTVVKNQEMLKFVLDHLKTKKMCKHEVKKFPYLLRSVPNG